MDIFMLRLPQAAEYGLGSQAMTYRVLPLISLLSLAAPACGGDVTVSGQGGASQGNATTGEPSGTGASSGTDPTTMAGPSPTTSSGSTGLCDAFCNKATMLGCSSPSCQSECAKLLGGMCGGPASALLQCFTDYAKGCEDKDAPECADEIQAFQMCQGGGCGPEECSGSGSSGQSSCQCDAECPSGKVTVSCSSSPVGDDCECFVNDVVVAKCSDPVSTGCSLQESCCAQFF
jgi:hypothetical protein